MTYRELLRRYLKKHKKLVTPNQGFNSLEPKLWLAYSMGRKRGFTDLGTYASKRGDHGWDAPRGNQRIAAAFDLGRRNRFYNKGWNYLVARRLFKFLVKHHIALNIDYVILGMWIWSRRNGLRRYNGDTSHMYHLHVSMYWPGKW